MVNEGSPGFGRVADCRVLTAVLVERGDGRTLGFEFLELIFEGIDCAEVVLVVGFDTDMCLICREGLTEAFLLTLREPITRGAQKKPDLIEGIALAPAVTGRVLLDAATHLTWGVASELDDMEGIEDAGGVLELIVDGVLSVPGRDPPSRSGYRSESLRRALLASSHARCQTCLGPGLTSGPWDDPPLEWSTMPVSSRGPRRRRPW